MLSSEKDAEPAASASPQPSTADALSNLDMPSLLSDLGGADGLKEQRDSNLTPSVEPTISTEAPPADAAATHPGPARTHHI